MGKEKQLVESVLFSSGKPVSVQEIHEATGLTTRRIRRVLKDLMEDYNVTRRDEVSLEIVHAGNKYAMQVKHEYADQSLAVAEPDLDSNVLKTLSMIAFHQPIKQSDLRRMVGQKIYDHVDELVEMRLVHAKKMGSTEVLTTTKRFPEYFGIESTKPKDIREFLAHKVMKAYGDSSLKDTEEP
jgi:segregation and condensation protein B